MTVHSIRACHVIVALGLLGAGCAAKPDTQIQDSSGNNGQNDPYEQTNRKLYGVSDALDKNAIRPVTKAYRAATPAAVRTHLHDLLTNMANPAQFANDVFQGKPRKAGNTFMRLLINTTIGVGGVFDVASGWGYSDHSTDFGLTLAVWGVPSGPYLFLPVLGPSNPRDGIAYGVNSVLSPFTWVSFGGSATLGYARFGVGAIDSRDRVMSATDTIEKTALDPYASYRSLYLQHRQAQIENARQDLPATMPDWFPGAAQAQAVPTAHVGPNPAPRFSPPASLSP